MNKRKCISFIIYTAKHFNTCTHNNEGRYRSIHNRSSKFNVDGLCYVYDYVLLKLERSLAKVILSHINHKS